MKRNSRSSSRRSSKKATPLTAKARKSRESSLSASSEEMVDGSQSLNGRKRSSLEAAVLSLIRRARFPEPIQEFKFHPTRKWRFDFAWPDWFVACEAEGGIWRGGRHQTARGYTADCEKYSEAAILGWTVVRVTSLTLKENKVSSLIRRALESMGWEGDQHGG